MNRETILNAYGHAIAHYNRLWTTVMEWQPSRYEENEALMKRRRLQADKFRARLLRKCKWTVIPNGDFYGWYKDCRGRPHTTAKHFSYCAYCGGELEVEE
jgi:hypothetical protein